MSEISREAIQRLSGLATELARDRGELALFALVERVDTPGFWDVVVSASWIRSGDYDTVKDLTGRVFKTLEGPQRPSLSTVLPLAPNDRFVTEFEEEVGSDVQPSEGGIWEFRDLIIGDVPIKRLILLANRPHPNGSVIERNPGGFPAQVRNVRRWRGHVGSQSG